MAFTYPHSRTAAARWMAALAAGSLLGLSLRLCCFVAAVFGLSLTGHLCERLGGLFPALDPVYTRAAEQSLFNVQIAGVAVFGPLGDQLHAWSPQLFAPASQAHWSFVRLLVEPGSPVLGRLVGSGLAQAAVLTAGLLVVRYGARQRRSSVILAGVAMQVQVAIAVLGSQPSIRELEATGIAFASNALLPNVAPRSQALGDGAGQLWPPLLTALLVGLALLKGYLPAGLVLLLRARARRITFGTAAIVMLGSAACAGVLRVDAAPPPPVEGITSQAVPATVDAVPAAPHSDPAQLDRWFSQAAADQPPAASRVEVVGSDFHYQYLVNGQPQLIKGMGLNTQYAQQLSPSDRAARIDSDMSKLAAMGVNTVLGWDPNEFDSVLLDAAQRHGIGVVLPFDLDPDADYTDPGLRQQLHDQVLAWVARYRGHPALRMWGLGNEVLHKIVHPAWVGPQDPAQERQAEAFSDFLVQTADDIHALDPDHPVTYRSAEDAFVDWVIGALDRAGGGPRPWFVWGANCYTPYLQSIVSHWPEHGVQTALWISEFAPGGMAVPDRPQGFTTMWGYIRQEPDWVLGGGVYAWTRNGPEGVDRDFGLTDDGVPADGPSLDMLSSLFKAD